MDMFGIRLMWKIYFTSSDPDEIAWCSDCYKHVRRGVLWRFTNGFFGGRQPFLICRRIAHPYDPMKHDLFCEDPQQSTQSLPMDPVALEGTKGSPVTIPQSEPSEAVRYGWIYRATSPQSWYIMIISLWILDSYQPQRIISIRIFRLLSHRYRLLSWYIMIISF